ncbi:PAS domain-containing protein [Chitinophaga sp. Hz27]|uniref:PAS domain-containing protein n=1 Tax=Chitinophaga sp. Hz27 TaxID=3347169 RepID=UPI0035DCB175
MKSILMCLLVIVACINGYFLVAANTGLQNIAVHFQYLFLCNELLLFAAIAVLILMATRKAKNSVQYERLFYDHPIPMWIYEKDTLRFLSVNNAAVIKYGYSRREFLQLTIKDIRDPGELGYLMNNIKDRCNGVDYRGIWKHRQKNGHNFFVELYAHSVIYRGRDARFIMAKDVDEQVKSAQKATEQGSRYEVLAQTTNDAIYDRNLITGEIAWNHGLSTIFHHHNAKTNDNLHWWKDNIHPDDRQKVVSLMENAMLNRLLYWSAEYRFQCADGTYKYISDRASITYDGPVAIRMIGIIQDIDHHVRQSKKLEEQNRTLKEITWINSHEIRRPVVSILSIAQLFDVNNRDAHFNAQLMDWLQQSTLQLDEIIHKIEKKAREIHNDPNLD